VTAERSTQARSPVLGALGHAGVRDVAAREICCGRALRHRLRCDMGMDRRQAVGFIAAVPAGFWTAYSDVAAACGSHSPRSIGFWLRGSGGTIPNYWRVLTVKGEVPETFVGGGSGPLDAESARDRLRREGVWVDAEGIADDQFGKDRFPDLERIIALGARVRLCKGAYQEPPQIAYKDMPTIRRQYVRCAERLLAAKIYPGIATHDPVVIEAIKTFVQREQISSDVFEFQMLYGVRPELQRTLVEQGYRVRIYIPFGTHWATYFYRRVTERRENALFALRSMWQR